MKIQQRSEAAVNVSALKLGNATEMMKLNRQYRMPFDQPIRSYAMWSGIVALIVYTAYPYIKFKTER